MFTSCVVTSPFCFYPRSVEWFNILLCIVWATTTRCRPDHCGELIGRRPSSFTRCRGSHRSCCRRAGLGSQWLCSAGHAGWRSLGLSLWVVRPWAFSVRDITSSIATRWRCCRWHWLNCWHPSCRASRRVWDQIWVMWRSVIVWLSEKLWVTHVQIFMSQWNAHIAYRQFLTRQAVSL